MQRVLFDHIAIGVPAIGDTLPFLVGELGGRPAGGGLTRAFAFRQWHFGAGKLEVLEPAGAPGGFMHRFLDRRGPGVHHVTFEVPDIDAVCAKAESMGFAVVERDDSDPEWSEAFLHPKTSMSIVVQIVQVRRAATGVPEPSIVEPEPGDPDPGALGIELIGLRLEAKRLARARELWCELLAGHGRVMGGELEVRWPGSPMRLVVRRSGADGGEGPLAIEIACLRPVLVPVGHHPVLGAAFETVDITELQPPAAFDGRTPSSAAPESPAGDSSVDDSYFLDPDALELEDQERS
ncbi:MAG TPA: VOC family protein [Thermoanaerobaculia bacterium]|nr:VOC family protein [Thermoanaerobaculia bacterium]